LRGVKIGGASFSDKHLNFLMNDGSATYNDVISLINLAKQLVYEKCQVQLELEVKHIGGLTF
jgi:UDP-N-acetylmuramate dehydrogenase